MFFGGYGRAEDLLVIGHQARIDLLQMTYIDYIAKIVGFTEYVLCALQEGKSSGTEQILDSSRGSG